MKVTSKKIKQNKMLVSIVLILGFLMASFAIFKVGTYHVGELVDKYTKSIFIDMKQEVKNEVLNRVDEIEYEQNMVDENQRRVVKRKIGAARKFLLQSDIVNIADPSERQLKAAEYYRSFVLDDPDFLYFALSPNGYIFNSGTHEELKGVRMYDAIDSDGVYFIRELIKAAYKPEGVYVTYKWPKVSGAEPLEKSSYALYLPEFDIVIGTGVYKEDLEKKVKENIFQRFQSYYEGSENYIFVTSYDGVAEVFADSSVVGQSVASIKDTNGSFIHADFMNLLSEQNEGYHSYNYYKKGKLELSEKISYVKKIDDWEVYIGMGFHTNDMFAQATAYTKESAREYYFYVALIITGLLLLTLIVAFLIKRGSKLQRELIEQEETLFEQLFRLSQEGIIIIDNNSTVLYMNVVSGKMFRNSVDDYIINGELSLEEIRDNIYIVQSPSERVYYVELNTKKIIYHGQDCSIYFIKNITHQYLQTNELEIMALHDEYTGLPNRRKLLNDFQEYLDSKSSNNITVLGIIDIDNFKRINDTYGHDKGDEVLKLFGNTFKNRLREDDQIYRYGGDEFVVTLSSISINDGKKVLTEIKDTFSKRADEELGLNITFSGGAIPTKDTEEFYGLENCIQKADVLLYTAKCNGRNRIEI